jgi:hypothetical protein
MSTPLYRGIASFVSAYAGTVKPGETLTLRANEPSDPGIGVYVGRDKLASVALDGQAGDTRERLQDELPKLYPCG